MSWKGFKDWLLGAPPESPLKDWEPGRILHFPTAPQEPAAWSDANLRLADAVVTVGLSSSTDGESDFSNDENNEPGGESWYPVETIEGEPPVRLDHAESLPSSTFRVFPSAGNHRNSYDMERGVKGAIAQRRRWHSDDVIRAYRAETVWRDVTEEYVKP